MHYERHRGRDKSVGLDGGARRQTGTALGARRRRAVLPSGQCSVYRLASARAGREREGWVAGDLGRNKLVPGPMALGPYIPGCCRIAVTQKRPGRKSCSLSFRFLPPPALDPGSWSPGFLVSSSSRRILSYTRCP